MVQIMKTDTKSIIKIKLHITYENI